MNNPFDFFSEIYCINLDSRPDKWETVQKCFKTFNIKVKRVSGIRYDKSDVASRFKGAVGLSLTVLKIIENAKKNNLKSVLIFEDDVVFKRKDVYDILNNAIKELPEDWGLFTLGGNIQKDTTPFSKHLSKNVDSWGTQAWAINSIHYDKLIEYIKGSDFLKEPRIDVILCKKVNFDNYFIVKPLIATQKIGLSDINGSVNDTLKTEDENEKKHLK